MNFSGRLDLFFDRQGGFEWGDTYEPAIQAWPREAPRGSRISRMNSRLLNRTVHLLSRTERVLAQLALMNPNLIDLHEQKLLSVGPCMHPLYGHPLSKGEELPHLRGTVCIAEAIGYKHFQIVSLDENGDKAYYFYPYLGDLLLYLKDEDGRPYAVNWNIKLTAADFSERKRDKLKTREQKLKDEKSEELRHFLEDEYYRDGGIRTLKLSLADISNVIIANLDQVYGAHDRKLTLEQALLKDYEFSLIEALQQGTPLGLVAAKYSKKWGARDQFICAIYQSIYKSNLKVNFEQPIHIDKCLNLSDRPLHETFSHLFARSAK